MGPYSEIVQSLPRYTILDMLLLNYNTANLVYSSLNEVAARLEEGAAVVGGVGAQVRSPVLALTSDDVSQLLGSFLRSNIRESFLNS